MIEEVTIHKNMFLVPFPFEVFFHFLLKDLKRLFEPKKKPHC
jgi:hypothetical protein